MLPKTLQAGDEYPYYISDEYGLLVLSVLGPEIDAQELKAEIIYRYNAYETLRDVLKHAIAIVAERELERNP